MIRNPGDPRTAIDELFALGFFADLGAMAPAERARTVQDRAIRERDELPDPTRNPQLRDMVLMSTDRARVWWRDIEGVMPGERFYETTLAEWAAISRGTFAPSSVEENWRGDRGPAHIHFELGGKSVEFVHSVQAGDMLDPRILGLINRHLPASAGRFCVSDAGGMPNFVVFLTRPERAAFEARGWIFYEHLD